MGIYPNILILLNIFLFLVIHILDKWHTQPADYINDLIAQGEHQQLDFKFEINDARKIARTLSAFANTVGGKLLIGVKDNGKIAGIRSEEEYHMIEAAAQMYCKPELIFESRKWDILGKTILEVTIEISAHRPCLAQSDDGKWLAYVRVRIRTLKRTGYY